jgi:hypothetical protein
MGNYWSIHLPHLLEPNGTLAPLAGRGLRYSATTPLKTEIWQIMPIRDGTAGASKI